MGKRGSLTVNNFSTALENGSANAKDIDAPNGLPISIANGVGKDIDKSGKDGKNKKNKKKEEEKPTIPPVPYFSLFRLATASDKILLIVGSLSAFAGGVCTPLMIILFGRITETFVTASSNYCDTSGNVTDTTPSQDDQQKMFDDMLDELDNFALYMGILGAATLILIYTFVTSFNTVAEHQVHRLRHSYLAALLRQNVGWYDTNEDRNFVSRIAEDLIKIQEAMGEKVGLCIYFMAVCVFSLANAFWHGWKLTLVVLSSAPVLAIAAGVVATIQSKLTSDEQGSYAKAGKVAEEAITNVRTVMAFSGQEKELERYESGLSVARTAGKKRGIISGIGVGLMWLIIYASYGLAFWYGTKLILEGREDVCKGLDPEYSTDNMLIIFFSVLMGAFNVGQAASYFEAFASGKGAAAGIFKVLDRIPEIDSYSEKGKKPTGRASGKIVFDKIEFSYPSRADVQILKGFSLSIEPGQTVALVGHSGCGKSTCLQLLQRFYDPLGGTISLDGNEIKDLHLGWLRSQIGVVSQEPILFNTTIAENIRYGRDGVTQQEIEEAAKQSNAHIFISKLPNGYHTRVGDRGAQLSGGQKQRVAIARALVKNPAILLLDEATSALDTQSESTVQAALDRARLGRTTLIVAHRLSTIRAADLVVSIDKGQVEEKGTHSTLLEAKGLYYQLVTAQMGGDRNELEADPEQGAAVDKLPLLGRRSIPTIDEEMLPYIPPISEDSLDEKELAKEAPIRRLLKLNQPEWPYIALGTVMAVILGAIVPFYAIIFGEFLLVFSKPNEEDVKRNANEFAMLFVGIGILAGVAQFLQMFAFTFSGESLTLRVRKLTFAAILRQEPGWFDDSSRSIGSLCARLSGDAASINGATGNRIGSVVQALSTIVLALSLSMYYLPKLAAVAAAFGCIVVFSTYFEGKLMTGQNIGEKKGIEEASKIAVESVSNIRTVASLCKERSFVKSYAEGMEKPHRLNLKMAHLRGFIFGIAQSMPLFSYAVVMWYGAYLIVNEPDDDQTSMYAKVFKVAESLIFGTMMIGQAMAFAPNYNKAKVSGARILRLLDRKPLIDNSADVGTLIKNTQGRVDFDKVEFSYPTRPSAKILKSLTLAVEAGKKIAIVGPSGSGKSTCIQLILRFYDPRNGTVKLDQMDVASLNVESLRLQLAIVAQEPALFDRTVRENIAYGDNSRQVSVEEVIKAARMANIHTFISSLPTGYETRVGEMGTQLSGGQKQRIAIARALVRNPKVLLLDEATSALDMESEQVVQTALEAAAEGRTSITIAHRLSSIQQADCIFVVNNGELAESGTHGELLQQRGIYHRLWNMQGGQQSQSNSEKEKP